MRGKLGKVLYDLSALMGCLIFLVAVLWACFSGFRHSRDLFVFPANLDFRGFTLENFQAVFASGNIPRYALNSLIVATLSSLLTVLASSMAGFALAKYKFPGRRIILFLILSVLLVPLQVFMCPLFLILNPFAWFNQFTGLIVPPAATTYRTFM